MSNPDNQTDIQRRRLVQGAIISSAVLATPGIASAVCGSGLPNHISLDKKIVSNPTMLTSDDLAIELVETDHSLKKGKLARVTITNTSLQSIKLSYVSPGAISTQHGVYQINARLSTNPLAIRPGGVYQFWLTPDDGTQALLSGKPKTVSGEGGQSTTLEISVITKLETGRWTGTQRVQALIS